jgi:hypothetical protein
MISSLIPHGSEMTSKASATGIPGTEKIVFEAWNFVTKSSQEKIRPAYVEKNFSEVCELLFYETYSIYKKEKERSVCPRSSRHKTLS